MKVKPNVNILIGLGLLPEIKNEDLISTADFTRKRAFIWPNKIFVREEVEEMYGQEWVPVGYPDIPQTLGGKTTDIRYGSCTAGPIKH